MSRVSGTWRNWAGNQVCAPARIEAPASEADLVDAVKRAANAGRTVKMVGAGHSFTDVACTTGTQLRPDRYDAVLDADVATGRVTVQSGITLADLNLALAGVGLALPNLGDIAYQTVAGAVSTSTHGTGARLGGLATQVVGLTLVTADGSVLQCDAEHEPEVFACARVGLGALGVLSSVTLQCVVAFRLHAVERAMRLEAVLESVDELMDGNDHFECYWVPHTGWALTKANNRTDEPVGGRTRTREWVSKELLENVAFGLACRAGRSSPRLGRRLARMTPSAGRADFVDHSYRVFTSPRHVRFCEMEYSIPRAELAGAVRRLKDWVDRSGVYVSFPVEVRTTAADDIPLSTANGRDSAYVAVHMYQGTPYEQYFRAAESIFAEVGGRPHWGKLHFQSAATLAPRYPEWDRFQAVRRRLDPDGRFTNAYLDRVLGPIAA